MSLARVLLLAFAFQTAKSFRFNLPTSCEKISIPLCRLVLPYNLTRFPNLVGDPSQVLANRSIQRYARKIHSQNSSRHAIFFLCSYYLPICIPEVGENEDHIIKPCRSLCKQVQNDYFDQRQHWPKFLKCEELPDFSDGMCIHPDSFISVSKPSLPDHRDHDACQERLPADNLAINRQFDYVIKLRVTLIERLENKGMTIRGKVGRVFKHSNVTINKGQRVKISSDINSTCPSLKSGRILLIGGYEDTARGQLLFSSTSLIEAWSDDKKQIRKWQRLAKKGKKKGRKSSRTSNL